MNDQSVRQNKTSSLVAPRSDRIGDESSSGAPSLLFHRPAESHLTVALAAHFFPDIGEWMPLLARWAVTVETAVRVHGDALRNGTQFEAELIASGIVTEDAVYAGLAEEIGVGFLADVPADRLVVSDANCMVLLRHPTKPVPVKIEEAGGRLSYVLVPRGRAFAALLRLKARYPHLGKRIRIAAPSTLRKALLDRASENLSRQARNDLFDRYPEFSAKYVVNAQQGLLLGAATVATLVSALFQPRHTLLVVHLVLTLFFLCCVTFRMAAKPVAARADATDEGLPRDLPVYSVLVALYRETEVAGQLIAALGALVWPKSKLEIKLVCEADDLETIAALKAARPPSNFEILEVPPGLPRTKPKALNYALPTVSGEFVVLYDAEDRPHPLQLVDAWRRFSTSPRELACLQAPLDIANGAHGRIARLFAFEYAALFHGLLPWLSDKRVLLPLGGTSNHFRVDVLREVGGWDPYNVTEDADLGFRLARFGCFTGTITRPTLEDAPERFNVWLPQRTRWLKGWMQTWMVHMRDPVELYRELGFRSFCVAQLVCTGLVFSALVHPLLVLVGINLFAQLAAGMILNSWDGALLLLDLGNIVCGYASFLFLGWRALDRKQRKGFWGIVASTPLYWMMLSYAAWRALWHLWRHPHLWEKTPHRRARAS